MQATKRDQCSDSRKLTILSSVCVVLCIFVAVRNEVTTYQVMERTDEISSLRFLIKELQTRDRMFEQRLQDVEERLNISSRRKSSSSASGKITFMLVPCEEICTVYCRSCTFCKQ